MLAGRLSRFASPLAILALILSAAPLFAQDAASDNVENSKYRIEGVINANAVFVRSGASDNDYPTVQLSKDAHVTVVGERFNWLKILPPDQSFCYVAKAYVNRAGDGTFGQIIGTSAVNVRIGSSLNLLKTKIATTLEPNQRVEILGEQDEYYKIKPPASVFYFVNKQFVDPVRQLPAPNAPQVSSNDGATTQPSQNVADGTTQTITPTIIGTQPQTSNPQIATAEPATTQPSTTQPTASAEAEFDRLETLYSQSAQRPLDDQPIDELLKGYQKLAASDTLPESMRRIAEFKLAALQTRAKMLEDYASVKKNQEDMKSKQMALQAEATELKDRVDKAALSFYTAVGTLRTSSLQYGNGSLYRLTDPANGRTIVYIRSDDAKLASNLGSFIGVRGEVSTDAQRSITTITPTAFEIVDPAKLGQNVVSQFAPPSLLPGVASGAGDAQGGQ